MGDLGTEPTDHRHRRHQGTDVHLRIIQANPPASALALEALERAIGAALPSDFASFLAERDGCLVEDNVFAVGCDNNSGIQRFLGVSGMRLEKAELGERLSADTWPIADAEGGNHVCLRREREGWTVVFWDHELEEEIVLAPSFGGFLDSLERFDASSVRLKPGQVLAVWVDPALLAAEKARAAEKAETEVGARGGRPAATEPPWPLRVGEWLRRRWKR